MKIFSLIFLSIFFIVSPIYGKENCAAQKKDEFNNLLDQIKEIDIEMAMEARNAYGMVSSFEAFDDKSPACTHINRLLNDMKETIELYK